MSSAVTAQRAADCTPIDATSTQTAESTETSAEDSSPKTRQLKELTFFSRRITRFKGLRLDQHLRPNATIRRFVVLDELRHRRLLGQPRRREIEPLEFKSQSSSGSADTLWKTSEMWELAEREAIRLLRELAKRIDQIKTSEEPERVRRPSKQLALSTALQPVSLDGEVRGLLLHAGVREGGVFCIDLYDEAEGCVRRVEGPDLARALEVSEAQIHEVIHVKPTGTHATGIAEERTGTHGEGVHPITHVIQTFEILREARTTPHIVQSYVRRQA